MSRGPGRRQRSLLDTLARPGVDGVIVTDPEESHSEQVAMRRAAYTLERAGRVKLVVQNVGPGRSRLVAYLPDSERAPALRVVRGIDGKVYRAVTGAEPDRI